MDKSIKTGVARMHPKALRVVIGAGPYNNNPDWIQTEASQLNLLNRQDWERTFGPSSIAAILAEHVWEHLSYEQGLRAAEICFDFLERGGYIRCAVPDGFFPDEAYQRDAQVGGPGPQDHPAASHQFVFDYHTIATVFQTAGLNLLEYCDESGAFHANPWDEKQGLIYRSLRFDHRNRNGDLGYTSLLIDAIKPR